jgi:DNA-binding NarL/FixJ family response regulator
VIRVLLADDHPVVRAGLRAVLDLQDDLIVVAEAATVADAVARCRHGGIDLVLMDLQFTADPEGADGIEGTRRIRELPDPPVVVLLTTYDTESDVLAAIDAGAGGYLLKDAEPAELARSVRAAVQGETPLAPQVAGRLVRRTLRPDTSLSARELEVLELVAAGLGNQQIAERLFLSQATVKTHLVHVFGKLAVDSRTAAVAEARARGLIR